MVEERPPVETLRPTTLGLDESTFLIEERREHGGKRKQQQEGGPTPPIVSRCHYRTQFNPVFLCVLCVLCGSRSCGSQEA
jgi:hypothetical protein